MRVARLNRNYNGFDRYSHRVEFKDHSPKVRALQWVRVRNWLWEQFGPSAELAFAREWLFGKVPKWAWDSEKSAIYLRDEAYTMFILKKEFWENEENL